MEAIHKLKDKIIGTSSQESGNQETATDASAPVGQQFQNPATGTDNFKPDIENATNREITPDVIAMAGGASVPIQPSTHVFTPPTSGAGAASSIPSSLNPDGKNIGQELGSRQTAAPVGGHSPQEAAVAGGAGLNELEQE